MTVRIFRSTDVGGPGDTPNTLGAICTLWDALLVAGYPLKTITTLTRAGAVASALCTAHGLVNGTTHSISGCDQDEYNGNKVITVVDADNFTFPVVGTPSSPATGAPRVSTTTTSLGWRLKFTGTNKRAYQIRIASGLGFHLRLDHSVSTDRARLRGYETMTDVDNGSGLFPTVAQMANGPVVKSSVGASRSWMAVGDENFFYFFSNFTANPILGTVGFGYFPSYKAGDLYNCLIFGSDLDDGTTSGHRFPDKVGTSILVQAQNAHYIARAYTGTGSAIQWGKAGDMVRQSGGTGTGTINNTSLGYPAPIDGGLHLSRYMIVELAAGYRGYLRGWWELCHPRLAMAGVAHLDTVNGSDVLASRLFQLLDVYAGDGSTNRGAVELSDTWEAIP